MAIAAWPYRPRTRDNNGEGELQRAPRRVRTAEPTTRETDPTLRVRDPVDSEQRVSTEALELCKRRGKESGDAPRPPRRPSHRARLLAAGPGCAAAASPFQHLEHTVARRPPLPSRPPPKSAAPPSRAAPARAPRPRPRPRLPRPPCTCPARTSSRARPSPRCARTSASARCPSSRRRLPLLPLLLERRRDRRRLAHGS